MLQILALLNNETNQQNEIRPRVFAVNQQNTIITISHRLDQWRTLALALALAKALSQSCQYWLYLALWPIFRLVACKISRSYRACYFFTGKFYSLINKGILEASANVHKWFICMRNFCCCNYLRFGGRKEWVTTHRFQGEPHARRALILLRRTGLWSSSRRRSSFLMGRNRPLSWKHCVLRCRWECGRHHTKYEGEVR